MDGARQPVEREGAQARVGGVDQALKNDGRLEQAGREGLAFESNGDLATSAFFEPDLDNAMTAIAVEGGAESILAKFPLALAGVTSKAA